MCVCVCIVTLLNSSVDRGRLGKEVAFSFARCAAGYIGPKSYAAVTRGSRVLIESMQFYSGQVELVVSENYI